MNFMMTCVMDQFIGHWLLPNVLATTINLIVAMGFEAYPLLMGMKYLTNLMVNSTC